MEYRNGPGKLFDLSDKVAIVTGGAGDIGSVYAEALCSTGASVVIADLNLEASTAVADTLTAEGFRAAGLQVDVRSEASTAEMAASTIEHFGGIDILINNAAIMTDLPPFGLTNMPVAEWDRVLNVNLRGPLLCTQAVIESMEARGGGRVINGLSAGAFMAGGIYGVSKYALHGLDGQPRRRAGTSRHQRERDSPRTRCQRERLRQPSRGFTVSRGPRTADPGKDVGAASRSCRRNVAAVLTRRRLDQRADDFRRRRLDHAPLGRAAAHHERGVERGKWAVT